jgi:hypothetical protein
MGNLHNCKKKIKKLGVTGCEAKQGYTAESLAKHSF